MLNWKTAGETIRLNYFQLLASRQCYLLEIEKIKNAITQLHFYFLETSLLK